MAREYTNKILEMNDDGYFDKDALILDLLNWMSENDVKKFYLANEFDDSDIVDEDPDEGRDWGMEWYDTSAELA